MNPTISELVREMRGRLFPIYGEGEGNSMIRLIFFHLKGWNQTQLIINYDMPASENLIRQIGEILFKLQAKEPIQYILGRGSFHGSYLKLNRSTLIPRPETEQLVDIVIDDWKGKKDLNVLDVGTGSGAIAISLAKDLPFSNVTALDVSNEALEVARENAVEQRVNVKFINADIFTVSLNSDSFDIIVSNPPYIDESEKETMDSNVLNHEPHTALFVPDDNPLVFYKRIAGIGIESLKPGGRIYFEINPRHSMEMVTMMNKMGYKDVETAKDIYNKTRFLKGSVE